MAKNQVLSVARPDLVAEWNYEKNGDKKPEDFTCGSNEKVWWKLPYDDAKRGHFDFEWQAKISHRANGSGCPFLARTPKVWPSFNDLLTTHPELCKEWDYAKNIIKPSEVTASSNKKVWWRLLYSDFENNKTHLFEWKESIQNRARRGDGCPYLSNRKIKSDYNSLVVTHPELLGEWNYEKNEKLGIKPTEIGAGSVKRVWWKLVYHDDELDRDFVFEWDSPVRDRTFFGYGCPYLSGQRLLPDFNSLLIRRPDVAATWHKTKNGDLTPDKVTHLCSKIVWWEIEVNGRKYEWKATVNARVHGQTHPALSESKVEKLVESILEQENIKHQREHKFDNCRSDKNRMLPYDFALSEYNLLIECDGKQHFKSIDFYGGKRQLKERINYDNIKSDYAFANDIPLLRIPYIYDAVKDKVKIQTFILEFIETKMIPQEIIDFYSQFEFSTYAEYAKEHNKNIQKTVS